MEQALLGETAAKLMDSLENDSRVNDGEIIAVGIIAIIQKDTSEGPMTFSRTMSNEDIHHRVLGLFREGYEVIASGIEHEDPDSD